MDQHRVRLGIGSRELGDGRNTLRESRPILGLALDLDSSYEEEGMKADEGIGERALARRRRFDFRPPRRQRRWSEGRQIKHGGASATTTVPWQQ